LLYAFEMDILTKGSMFSLQMLFIYGDKHLFLLLIMKLMKTFVSNLKNLHFCLI